MIHYTINPPTAPTPHPRSGHRSTHTPPHFVSLSPRKTPENDATYPFLTIEYDKRVLGRARMSCESELECFQLVFIEYGRDASERDSERG